MGMPYVPERSDVLAAFDQKSGCYSNELPFSFSNFIDGMAWVGVLLGACCKVNDEDLADKCTTYLNKLIAVGPDARNYATEKVNEKWVASPFLEGYWYLEKPQSFAGPAGLEFAVRCGAKIPSHSKYTGDLMYNVKKILFTNSVVASLFGTLVKNRWLREKWLGQHINSIWLAFLVTGKHPPASMLWMTQENPFFAYIAGVAQSVEYPSPLRGQGSSEYSSNMVPLKDTKPSAWIFRRDPFSRWVKTADEGTHYTPIWKIVGVYLQHALTGKP